MICTGLLGYVQFVPVCILVMLFVFYVRFGLFVFFFFFKQKTAYEIVSRDWSPDVCSSDFDITALLMRFRNEGYTHHTTRDNNETLQIGSQIEPIKPAQYLDFR